MAKQLMFDDVARQKAASGIRQLADAVRVTLGPSGRNVLFGKKFGSPVATRDGVTVAKEIELPDPFENTGVKLVQNAAEKTNDEAGDGTTTCVVLADAIYREGLRALASGANPVALRRGIEKAVAAAIENLETQKRPADDEKTIRFVALVASHYDDAIADIVTKAVLKAGKEGVVTVEEGKGTETRLEHVDGLQFDKGYISPYFITNPRELTAELEDAYILLTDKKLANVSELIPILEKVAQTGKPLFIVAEEVEGEALAVLVINRLRGVLRVCAAKAPAFGDRRKAILQDIAILTGGQVVSDDTGLDLEHLKLEHLGRAERVRVEKEKSTIIGGKGDPKKREAREAEIRTLIARTTSDYDREKLEERLAKIQGGVSVIEVGGATESDMKERKYRVEDAVHAAQAAMQEGIVPGGGTALIRAIPAVEQLSLEGDEKIGAGVVARALAEPAAAIARNAGHDPAYVVHEIRRRKGAEGFDARTGDFTDLFQRGVIDPLKVTRMALQNAASVAGLLLTSRTIVVELKEKEKAVEGATK
jgi:chaperonin GroEL